jgi:hypothetical protein
MLAAIRDMAVRRRLAVVIEYGVIMAAIAFIALTGIQGLNPPL